MNLSLSLSDDDSGPRWLDAALRDAAVAMARELEPAAPVGLAVVGDAFIRDINRRYRGKDHATDVISFSYLDDYDPARDDDVAGEIYVSHETVEKEARELGVDAGHLFLRLVVHGLLHVIGHVHDRDAEAARMEKEERRLLARHLDSNAVAELF